MELAKRILTYRIQNNLTQKELAKQIGISHVTIVAIEKNRPVMEKTKLIVELKLNKLEEK